MSKEVKKGASAPIQSSELEVFRRVLKVGSEAIADTIGSTGDHPILPFDSSVPFEFREAELNRRRLATGNFPGRHTEDDSEQKPEESNPIKPH